MSQFESQLDLAINKELRKTETLRWAEQPIPYSTMISELKVWFFAIPWTAFSYMWISGAAKEAEAASYFPYLGVPFLAIGIYLLLSPFWKFYKATKIVYVITNQRAFSLDISNGIDIRNFNPDSIGSYKKVIKDDGIGDLILSIEHYKDAEGYKQTREYGFFSIHKVNEVEKIILDLMNKNA